MATVNERMGSRPCPLCGAGLVIRRNPAGTVTMSCSGATGCDFSGFAKKGTKAAALLTQGLGEPTPAPAPAKAPAAPAPASSAFSLGKL